MVRLHAEPKADNPAKGGAWHAISFMRVEWPSILLGGHRLGTETYPAEHRPVHFVVSEQNLLISYAAIMHLMLDHAEHCYHVAAFGNVFTFPAFRGVGHGRQVVGAATHFIQTSGVDLGIVFCKPHLVSFYRASGWKLVDSVGTRVGTPASFTVHPYQRLMLFVSSHGRQNRVAFERHPLYIESSW